jgi:hypothetical protein
MVKRKRSPGHQVGSLAHILALPPTYSLAPFAHFQGSTRTFQDSLPQYIAPIAYNCEHNLHILFSGMEDQMGLGSPAPGIDHFTPLIVILPDSRFLALFIMHLVNQQAFIAPNQPWSMLFPFPVTGFTTFFPFSFQVVHRPSISFFRLC